MIKKNKNALIFFIKAPRLGKVKTRLQPEFTLKESLILYKAMVEDSLSQLEDPDFWNLYLFFYPNDAESEIKTWLGNRFDYFPQYGVNLGQNMAHAITDIFNKKHIKVVLAGSDIPTLDRTTIQQAFTSLNDHDLALGPCPDGGYYLIGMRQAHTDLFYGIPWSTDRVYNQTIQKAENANLKIKLLNSKPDIDTYSDAETLWKYLKRKNMKNIESTNSKTFNILTKIFEPDCSTVEEQNNGTNKEN